MLLRACLLSVLLVLAASVSFAAEGQKPKYDLSQFKSIAEETLKLVSEKSYPAAEKKIVELEDKWDEGTKPLKAADRKVWTVIDKQMDAAIEAVKACKDDTGAVKATKEINNFISKLKDGEQVK